MTSTNLLSHAARQGFNVTHAKSKPLLLHSAEIFPSATTPPTRDLATRHLTEYEFTTTYDSTPILGLDFKGPLSLLLAPSDFAQCSIEANAAQP